jgi:serine/threonine protein kinase
MPSRKFGKYEVLARLATGGAANIFLARQPGAAGFHKLVCLKTLLPERASDADFVAMFLDEARLAARLNHPNCVQIYDLGRVRGSYYISMEYIFGETLWNLLATVTRLRTPLPPAHVASIIASVCDGLHHAHELKDSNGRPFNLVHRDVSPQNVMVTFEGQTKVVDFGIAKAETGRAPTVAGIVKGKFSYMSPEQITGSPIDRRSDVYSLGIVLFECLASRRLYRGDSPEEIARLILEHRAPRLRDVVPDTPPELDQICGTALARHASKRYQTAQDMGDALRDYLDGIRYTHSTANIAKLVDERFKGQIPERRKVFESALSGTVDEMHLLKVLDARAVREIDLFADPEDFSGEEDFEELSSVADLPPESSNDPPAKVFEGEEETGEVRADDAPLINKHPEFQSGDDWKDDGSDETRIDANAESEAFAAAAAAARAANAGAAGDRTRIDPRGGMLDPNTASTGEMDGAVDATYIEHARGIDDASGLMTDPRQAGRSPWENPAPKREIKTLTDQQRPDDLSMRPESGPVDFGDATSIDFSNIPPVPPSRNAPSPSLQSSGPTPGALPVVGPVLVRPRPSDVIALQAPRPDNAPPPLRSVELSPFAPDNGRRLESLEVSATYAAVPAPPPVGYLVGTPAPSLPAPPEGAVVIPRAPDGLLDARFGISTVIAALGMGIAIGIVFGFLLSRALEGGSAQVIPVRTTEPGPSGKSAPHDPHKGAHSDTN